MIDVYCLDGKLTKGDFGKIEQYLGKPLWIDITGITKEDADKLKDLFNLHPLTAEDLHNSPVRIKVEEFNDYLLCVFYGIKKVKTIDLIELDFVLGKDFLITNHRKELDSIKELKQNEDKIENQMRKGTDFLFHKILDMEVDNFSPALESLDDEIEKIEEEATKDPKPKLLSEILKLKRLVVHVKKVVMPQREKIGFLAKNEYKHISKKAIPYFRDIYDHSIRVSDTIDNYREAIGNAFDAYMSAVSNNMNEVMKVLSIIATIALPLTVVSGIYGTNFTVLPGQTFAYGFWVMVSVMVVMCVVMIYYFRKKKWI
ncbi:magnesium/cobalt transporter CorA [Candidatus Woesearchaeota archaeon]|nr:magnesium/cobalt transporter CorA [Candidatus Woesearchaeota archaeon]